MRNRNFLKDLGVQTPKKLVYAAIQIPKNEEEADQWKSPELGREVLIWADREGLPRGGECIVTDNPEVAKTLIQHKVLTLPNTRHSIAFYPKFNELVQRI